MRPSTNPRGIATFLTAGVTALVAGKGLSAGDDLPDELADLLLATIVFGPLFLAHVLLVRRALTDRSFAPFMIVWRGVGAGVLAGVAVGVGLRVGMRLVALAAGDATEFTVGGSLLVVGLGVVIGATYGSLFSAVRQRLPARHGGPAFGLLIGLLLWFPFLDTAAGDLRGVASEGVIVSVTALLSGMWLVYGVLIERLAAASATDDAAPGR